MLGRLLTAIFYAVFFFWLGAWSGGRLEPMGDALYKGAIKARVGAEALWRWAFRSGDETTEVTEAYHAVPEVNDLGNARGAFSRGDIQTAVTDYKAYLTTHPADADAHGELGNVYFHSGQVGKAAGSFYTAALLLLSEDRKADAEALLPAISAGAPGLADDLRNRIALAGISTADHTAEPPAAASATATARPAAVAPQGDTHATTSAAPASH